jgi:ATP-dependent exoDNAse (exonuclease V) alpha subunit
MVPRGRRVSYPIPEQPTFSTESEQAARERLYVGMSRATDELVVVGEPETVRRVAGEDVARRLGV